MRKIIAVAFSSLAFMPASHAADIFANPQETCSSLNSEGLPTGGWKASKAFQGEWLCMTTLVPFGQAGSNGMENNIAFYVNGTSPNRANDIRIKINVNNDRERGKAFARLRSATQALFRSLGQSIPSKLTDALAQQKPAEFSAEFGKVELLLETGRIDSYKVVLTDASFLDAEEKKIADSVTDFDRCKSVVAKKVGYSPSLLSGDGKPVQEPGYKSFMLNGRNKDLFFCEVHSGGRYKIKAALGGSFPFKYIEKGHFN